MTLRIGTFVTVAGLMVNGAAGSTASSFIASVKQCGVMAGLS